VVAREALVPFALDLDPEGPTELERNLAAQLERDP
jgi:hypothetical protein